MIVFLTDLEDCSLSSDVNSTSVMKANIVHLLSGRDCSPTVVHVKHLGISFSILFLSISRTLNEQNGKEI